MLLSHRCAWVGLLSLSLCGTAAAAEPDAGTRAAARTLAEDGVSALQNGDAATAVQKLEKAHRALQAPSVALWSARALVKLGLLVEARERYIEATRLPISGDKAVQEQAKLDAQAEGDQLLPRIPSLLVSVAGEPAGLSVTVDGKELPELLLGEARPTNPGQHQVVAKRGAEQARETLTLTEGEHRRLELKLALATGTSPTAPATAAGGSMPEARKPGSTKRTLGLVAIVAGGAGLVTGGVTGFIALNKKKALDDDERCLNGQCLYSAEAEVKSLRTFRTISTVGFVAGGVLAAAGVTLLLTAPRPESAEQSARVSLRIGPAQLSVHGTF
jgi:hypothetical protein